MTTYKSIKYNISGADLTGLTAGQIPNLDTAKITTGTMANARISAGSVTQHVTATDLTPVRHDILTLGLKQAVQENSTKFNLPNSAITKFEADADFNLAGSTDVTRNASEYISSSSSSWGSSAYVTGNRTSDITVSTVVAWSEAMSNLVNGDTTTGDGSNSTYPTTASYTTNGAEFLKFDFGASFSNKIDAYKSFGQNQNTGQSPTGKVQGSNNDSDWTDLKTGISNFLSWSGTSSQEETWTHSTVYRYIRFVKTAGTFTSSGWWYEFQFKESALSESTSATGTALGTTNVPTSAVTDVSGVMLLKNAYGTNTLGTDVKVYFTADNSNWTEAASYADAGTFSTGIKMIKLGKTTCTSGSDVRWKAVWANQSASSKEGHIYGIGLNY